MEVYGGLESILKQNLIKILLHLGREVIMISIIFLFLNFLHFLQRSFLLPL